MLLVSGCLASGFVREFVMRGYLLTRLEELLHSTWLAVLATTVLFAGWHFDQGMEGILAAAGTGLVFGVSFCLMRRLWPLALAHALLLFLAIVGTEAG